MANRDRDRGRKHSSGNEKRHKKSDTGGVLKYSIFIRRILVLKIYS